MNNYKLRDKFDRKASLWNKFIRACAESMKNNNLDLFLLTNDKLKVKTWMQDFVSTEHILPPLVIDKDPAVVFEKTKIPNFYLKCNLYSGLNARIQDGKFCLGRTTDATDYNGYSKFKNDLLTLYQKESFGLYEYQKCGTPLYFSESALNDIVDYKHFFIYGDHFMTQTVYNIEQGTTNIKEAMVWPDGSPVGAQLVNAISQAFVKPKSWNQQIAVCKPIAKYFDFIRIDVITQEDSDKFYIAEIEPLPRRGNYKAKDIMKIINPKLQKDYGII